MPAGCKWQYNESAIVGRAYAEATHDEQNGAFNDADTFNMNMWAAFVHHTPRGHQQGDGHYGDRGKYVIIKRWKEVIMPDVGKFLISLRKTEAANPTGGLSEDEIISIAVAVHTHETEIPSSRYRDTPHTRWEHCGAYKEVMHLPKFSTDPVPRDMANSSDEEEEEEEDHEDGAVPSIGDGEVALSGGGEDEENVRQIARPSAGPPGGNSNLSVDDRHERRRCQRSRQRKRGIGRDRAQEQANTSAREKNKRERHKERTQQVEELLAVSHGLYMQGCVQEVYQSWTMARALGEEDRAMQLAAEYEALVHDNAVEARAQAERMKGRHSSMQQSSSADHNSDAASAGNSNAPTGEIVGAKELNVEGEKSEEEKEIKNGSNNDDDNDDDNEEENYGTAYASSGGEVGPRGFIVPIPKYSIERLQV
jgi:hypothetical protein